MVVDIQGGSLRPAGGRWARFDATVAGVGDLYTDPQMHTLDCSRFGDGNLGAKGMALFFGSHCCNSICRLLGLPQFQLEAAEAVELHEQSPTCVRAR